MQRHCHWFGLIFFGEVQEGCLRPQVVSGLKTWGLEFGLWISLDGRQWAGPCVPSLLCSGSEWEVLCGSASSRSSGEPQLTQKCCSWPGSPCRELQLTALGPNWSHEPSASCGRRMRVCFTAQQDVASPGLYFFSRVAPFCSPTQQHIGGC